VLLNIIGIVIFWVCPLAIAAALLRCVYLEHRKDRVPILLYHRLISKEAAERGEVADDEMIWVCYDTEFAKQMNYLHDAGYTTLDLDDYIEIRRNDKDRPNKPVIVTFDDGYLSNYTLAYPAIRKNTQKAVIFVAPEPDDYTRNIVEGMDGFLSNDQMRELSTNGVSIQSHTLTHCVLNELDDKTARHELTESRKRLSEITGRSVDHIAIPRAGYSRRIRKLVREAGYQTACGNMKGTANQTSDSLALPRIVIERDMTVEDFARCLTPRGSTALRIIGNIKRIPERLGGSAFAGRVRRVLYGSPLRPLFETRNLKRIVAVFGALYLIGSGLFLWQLITS
jgi:peptidoglycan/xylan/chitin deacetylase (PgdA/CDA1 family)